MSDQIRRACVAGSFYPAEPRRLSADVDRMMTNAITPTIHGQVDGVVSPHAGYPFSGQLAAHSVSALVDASTTTVIMIGPSHVAYFGHSSVYPGDAYETPMGLIPVNKEMAMSITESSDSIRHSQSGHAPGDAGSGEHGIEVQLPFLQHINKSISIVPIVMGDQRWEHCVDLGRALKKVRASDPGVRILASSDLSHFYDSDKATNLDTAFCDVLANLDANAMYQAVQSGTCEACGAGPVVSMLIALEQHGNAFELIARTHSGDVTGDNSSVVGYASAVITRS